MGIAYLILLFSIHRLKKRSTKKHEIPPTKTFVFFGVIWWMVLLVRGLSQLPGHVIRRRSADLKDFNQRQTRNEAADMCSISDATRLRAAAQHAKSADQLEDKPKTDGDESRNLRHEI